MLARLNVTPMPLSTLTGLRCSPLCLGGCHSPNSSSSCVACVSVRLAGACADQCPRQQYEVRLSYSDCEAGRRLR